MKIMKIFVSMVILMYMILCIGGVSAAITYKSYVDLDYGFYKVIGIDEPANGTGASIYISGVNYTRKKLTINVGDTVLWINYDSKDWPITIMSQQGLWSEKDSYLKFSYRKFNHTFTKPGTYDVYVKENDRFLQTIVVNPTNPVDAPVGTIDNIIPESTETSAQTPIETPTQILITLEKISANTTSENTEDKNISGVGIIGVIAALLILYFFKNKNGE